MSASYTLHLPTGSAPGDPVALERAQVVRDGFAWGAFLVPMLWFFRHRHWLMGLAALGVVVGLAVVLRLLGVGWGTILTCEVLLHALIGLEGPSLRRLDLDWRGRPVSAVVLARDAAEAEAKSFARWLSSNDEKPAGGRTGQQRPTRPAPWRGTEPVIGLFPDSEGRR